MAIRDRGEVPCKYKDRPIYSISRLLAFNECEYQYYLNYILKLDKSDEGIYGVVGGFVHELIELLQANKITKEEAILQFNAKMLECEIKGIKFPTEKTKKNYMECLIHYLKNYKPIIANKVTMEKEFYTEISNVILLGYIDVVAMYENGNIEIYDYKTSSKYQKKDLDKHGLQLVLYAEALKKEFGVNVNSIKWNMLKYCWIRWKGVKAQREMFVQRNEIIKSLKTELRKDLLKEGKREIEIEMILNQAEALNDFSLFSEQVQNKYTIEDGYIEYLYNEETIKRLENFVHEAVTQIESKSIAESDWRGKFIIPKDSFFCTMLCDHSPNCKFYKRFVEANPELFEEKPQTNDIFKSLFG